MILNYVKYDDMKKDIKSNVRAIDRQIRGMLSNTPSYIALEREQKKMDLDIKKAAKAVRYYSQLNITDRSPVLPFSKQNVSLVFASKRPLRR